QLGHPRHRPADVPHQRGDPPQAPARGHLDRTAARAAPARPRGPRGRRVPRAGGHAVSVVYLLVLLASLGCMVLLDHRFRLFFFASARRATLVLIAGVAFFLAWDVAGISLGLFFRGETPYMTGLLLAPELPVE